MHIQLVLLSWYQHELQEEYLFTDIPILVSNTTGIIDMASAPFFTSMSRVHGTDTSILVSVTAGIDDVVGTYFTSTSKVFGTDTPILVSDKAGIGDVVSTCI